MAMDAVRAQQQDFQREQRRRQLFRQTLGLLDTQPQEWRSTSGSNRVIFVCFWLFVFVLPLLMGLAVWQWIGAFQTGDWSHVREMSSPPVFAILPVLLLTMGNQFFPRRYFRYSIEAMLRAAARGDDPLITRALPQPERLPAEELPVATETMTSLRRWNEDQGETRATSAGCMIVFAAFMLVLVGPFILILTLVVASGYTSEQWLSPPGLIGWGVAAALIVGAVGFGLLLLRIARRGEREARAMGNDLTLSVDAEGITWGDPAWRKRRHMRIAWQDVRGFNVISYERQLYEEPRSIYLLDDGQTHLLWELPPHAVAEYQRPHDRLNRLIATYTDAPLRDLTPGVSRLVLLTRNANPLLQTRNERAALREIPPIPGMPLKAMRRWTHSYTIMLISGAIVFGAFFVASLVLPLVGPLLTR